MTRPAEAPTSFPQGRGTNFCRACSGPIGEVFADLGVTPLANAFVRPDRVSTPDQGFPLVAKVCPSCFLVQVGEYQTPAQIFGDYAYFSSYSVTWIDHARAFASRAMGRYRLDDKSLVVEVASNDGYLLKEFRALSIPVLGIEPAANVATVAEQAGVPTRVEFFGMASAKRLAAEEKRADLLVANNVLAHVPDIHDFVAGMEVALAPGGSAVVEFPHLLRLIEGTQFDTIYHEHFSYLSLLALGPVLGAHGLVMTDVEEIPTHGGSLRLELRRAAEGAVQGHRVVSTIARERAAGLDDLRTYVDFRTRVETVRSSLLDFLHEAKERGKRVAAYGAPAKGNTLLNFCGIGRDLIAFTVDMNPHKQGHLLPGSRIPIHHPEALMKERPDLVLILPWNLQEEIIGQYPQVRGWGGKFVVPIPTPRVVG